MVSLASSAVLRDPALEALAAAVHGRLLERDPSAAVDHRRVAAEVRSSHPLLPEVDVTAVAGAVTARAVGLGPSTPCSPTPTSPR